MSAAVADNFDVRHDNAVEVVADNILFPVEVVAVADNPDARHDNAAVEVAADNLGTCPDYVGASDRICDCVPIPYDRDVHFPFRDRECICL